MGQVFKISLIYCHFRSQHEGVNIFSINSNISDIFIFYENDKLQKWLLDQSIDLMMAVKWSKLFSNFSNV